MNIKGKKAEQQALRYLLEAGCIVISKNYSCLYGEIDLIMLDKDNNLLFIEVRYRSNNLHHSATESINYQKQKKISKTASYFLANEGFKYLNLNTRFDVFAFENSKSTWIKGAFECTF